MLSHVIPQCLVTDRIPIKLQLTGKSRLIFKFYTLLCQLLPGQVVTRRAVYSDLCL